MMTLGVYAKAVTADKRAAQDVIAAIITGKDDVKVAAERLENDLDLFWPHL
jgi:hypothetical protein